MSKKVLIIKPATYIDWKDEKKFTEALNKSIVENGIIYLPYCIDYEFGEIDGVIWEGEKKAEKKSNVDWDYLIDCLDISNSDVSNDPSYNVGYRDGLDVAKRLLLRAKDEVN